ncbi:MAG: hypothetical protein Q8L30_01720 [bacterium]|nr:hypothetical protein [bacterium]
MNHMRLLVSSAIIVVAIVITFIISVPRTSDVEVTSMVLPETEIAPTVILRDSFKRGIHTISGSVEAPNVCALVSASAELIGDAQNEEGILVNISMQTDSEICLQIPANISFETTIEAPNNLPISATVNGSLALISSS